jgi:hypothetical protein
MGWVIFEICLAVALAIFIVWWTLPKKKKPKVLPPDDVQPRD